MLFPSGCKAEGFNITPSAEVEYMKGRLVLTIDAASRSQPPTLHKSGVSLRYCVIASFCRIKTPASMRLLLGFPVMKRLLIFSACS